MFPCMNSLSQQAQKSKYEREKTAFVVFAYYDYKKGISEESMLSLWTENRTVTVLLELILCSCDFFHAFLYTFVSCITQMRFHHQLMRFHKTAKRPGQGHSKVIVRTHNMSFQHLFQYCPHMHNRQIAPLGPLKWLVNTNSSCEARTI